MSYVVAHLVDRPAVEQCRKRACIEVLISEERYSTHRVAFDFYDVEGRLNGAHLPSSLCDGIPQKPWRLTDSVDVKVDGTSDSLADRCRRSGAERLCAPTCRFP